MRRLCLVLVLPFVGAQVLGAQTKLSGRGTCGKSDIAHVIPVGDRPNHVFSISQTRCTWTKPSQIAGIRSKQGTSVQFSETSGDTSQFHGYYLDTMSNGDTVEYRYVGTTTLKAGAPQSAWWNWLFLGGTGKLQGLKGKGTCNGAWNSRGIYTWECRGVYLLPK